MYVLVVHAPRPYIRYHLLGHAVDIRKRQLYTVPTRKLHDHLGVI